MLGFTALGSRDRPMAMPISHAFDITHVAQRLSEGNGGYEIVHSSPGLELGVYVLVAPEPDRQQRHDDDEVYVVLEGSGRLDVEGPHRRSPRGARGLRPRRCRSQVQRL